MIELCDPDPQTSSAAMRAPVTSLRLPSLCMYVSACVRSFVRAYVRTYVHAHIRTYVHPYLVPSQFSLEHYADSGMDYILTS